METIRRRTTPLEYLLLLVPVLYVLHNAWVYVPTLGYDGSGHLDLIHQIAGGGTMSGLRYGSSNPPLYYWLAAGIYRLFHSDKAVQLLSWALYVGQIWIFRKALARFEVNRAFANLVTLFYALLPLSICYGVMVLNYSLANFLLAVVLYLYARVIEDESPAALIFSLMAATLAAAFTAMTGLAALCATLLVLRYLMNRTPEERKRYAALFVGISLLAYGTYMFARYLEIGCVLCTKNRMAGPPLTVAAFFRLWGHSWTKPYFPNDMQASIPILVHESFFSDYFNYLVPRRLWSNPSHQPWDVSGAFFVDSLRRFQLIAQNWLGLPLLLSFLYACWLKWPMPSRAPRDPVQRLKTAYVAFSALTALQFFCYINMYRNWVNFHAGYLYPIAFIGCLLMARVYGQGKWKRVLMGSLMAVYSALNLWTFWI